MSIATRQITIHQFAQQKAFVKSEMPLVEKSIKLSSSLSAMDREGAHVIVGGMAIRSYTDAKFKGRIGSGSISSTDVDVVLSKMPGAILAVCREEELAKPTIIMGSREIRTIEAPSVGKVFHLMEIFNGEMPLFYDVCFFENRIGKLSFQMEDYTMARSISFIMDTATDKYMMSMRIADLGLLGATMLNRDAITEMRAKRMAFAIASEFQNVEEVAGRYSKTVARGYASDKDIIKPLRIFLSSAPQSVIKEARVFAEKVASELGLGKIL